MVDASQGESSLGDAICHGYGGNGVDGDTVLSEGDTVLSEGDTVVGDGIDRDRIGFFVLGKQVEIVVESCARHLNEVIGVGKVGKDDGVVAFDLVGVYAVVADAAVFLDIEFVAEPIGDGAITVVLGGIEKIHPAVVVIGHIIGVDAGGVVVVVFKGEVKALEYLASELEVEMLFLVA